MIDSKERAKRFKDARTKYNVHGKQGLKEVFEATKKIDGTGVQASMISDLEASIGEERPVRYQKVLTLAEYYGVNVAWLMGQSDSRFVDEGLQALSKATGLSDNAIQVLNAIKEINFNSQLSRLLESSYFADMLYQFSCAMKINANNKQSDSEADTIERLQVFGIVNGMASENSRLSNRQLIDMYRRKAVESMNSAFLQILEEDKENGEC